MYIFIVFYCYDKLLVKFIFFYFLHLLIIFHNNNNFELLRYYLIYLYKICHMFKLKFKIKLIIIYKKYI